MDQVRERIKTRTSIAILLLIVAGLVPLVIRSTVLAAAVAGIGSVFAGVYAGWTPASRVRYVIAAVLAGVGAQLALRLMFRIVPESLASFFGGGRNPLIAIPVLIGALPGALVYFFVRPHAESADRRLLDPDFEAPPLD